MRPVYFAIIIVTVILAVFGSNLVPRVEAVEHHGDTADIKGNRVACLSCHNDKIAKSLPDNKVYPPPNRKSEFKPVADAQKNGVMFIDGKMDCTSCHGLQICYACHQKLGTVTGR